MMKALLLIAAVLGMIGPAIGQTFYAAYDPSPGNQVYFGGFQQILPTPDSQYVALSGVYEKVVAKLDANMDIVWCYKFDPPGGQIANGVYDMTISNDGKILVLGFGSDVTYIVKLNLDGSVIWKKEISSNFPVCGFYMNGKQIMNAKDNGFMIVGGTSEGHSMLVRMDENGAVIWAKFYEDTDITETARFNNGVQDGANSYMIQSSMRTASFFRIDDNGSILSKVHHDDHRLFTYPNKLMRAANGDFFSVGQSRDSLTNEKRQVISRIDANGGLVWMKEISVDTTFEMNEPCALLLPPNNEVVILSYFSITNSATRRTQVTRFDYSGNHLGTVCGWNGNTTQLYGGNYHDGYIYLAGYNSTERNIIAKLDLAANGTCNSGNVNMTVTDLTPTITFPNDQIVVSNLPALVSNVTWGLIPYTYTRNVPCGSTVVSNSPEETAQLQVSPQPANGDCILHHRSFSGQSGNLQLVDMTGKAVWKCDVPQGEIQTLIPRGTLAAGMYFLQGQFSEATFVRRILFQ